MREARDFIGGSPTHTQWIALDSSASAAEFREGVEKYPIPPGGRVFEIPSGGRKINVPSGGRVYEMV